MPSSQAINFPGKFPVDRNKLKTLGTSAVDCLFVLISSSMAGVILGNRFALESPLCLGFAGEISLVHTAPSLLITV